MPSVTIPAGTLHYRSPGPTTPTTSAGRLRPRVPRRQHAVGPRRRRGSPTAASARYLVDWPLGSHRTPMNADADLSPIGVARMVNEVLDALGLADVTLVGNDTGGAICQLLLADDAEPHRPRRADELRRIRELPAEGVRAAVPRRQAAAAHRAMLAGPIGSARSATRRSPTACCCARRATPN